jgi:uncharacterized membrane protein YeaQ/YmgE (transglycosylase-associated protein family)
MWNLLVFAVIGLFAGAAARLLYPGRRPVHILGTLVVGIVGALAGGMTSWSVWPNVDGEFTSGNLILSVVGAMIFIAFWAVVAYQRNLSGYRKASP